MNPASGAVATCSELSSSKSGLCFLHLWFLLHSQNQWFSIEFQANKGLLHFHLASGDQKGPLLYSLLQSHSQQPDCKLFLVPFFWYLAYIYCRCSRTTPSSVLLGPCNAGIIFQALAYKDEL